MTPQHCITKHDPPYSYGDCLRACIATILDLDAEQVPHFADRGVSAEDALAHVRQWLAPQGLTIASFALPGSEPLSGVMEYMEQMNPTVTWLLFGSTGPDGGDHVNVCSGGRVVHDPAWVPVSIKSAASAGIWQIWVICRV